MATLNTCGVNLRFRNTLYVPETTYVATYIRTTKLYKHTNGIALSFIIKAQSLEVVFHCTQDFTND